LRLGVLDEKPEEGGKEDENNEGKKEEGEKKVESKKPDVKVSREVVVSGDGVQGQRHWRRDLH
jgi:hypothetical protein